ncbi:MAG: hypothetical protein Ct9H300mP4_16980 [Gammaproteobacteria bacterium]|nr:MAG: hypothetical protein Ct9H300mP4_16980 [Gammaproteobacteria bacterium]
MTRFPLLKHYVRKQKIKIWTYFRFSFCPDNSFIPASESLPIEAKRAAAIFVWMGIWWATEAVPIAVTALYLWVFFPHTWCCKY